MARPPKTALIDYSKPHSLTVGLLDRASCPEGVAQVLLRDAEKPGLRLRITPVGKHWSFEARIQGKLFKRSLGSYPAIGLWEARAVAHDYRGQAERGMDPREAERELAEVKKEALATAQRAHLRESVITRQAWDAYVAERTPKWSARHRLDHENLARTGGVQFKRGKGTTSPGPLQALMPIPLHALTAPAIEAWAAKEGQLRPTTARLAWRLLRAFLAWCVSHPDYSAIVPKDNPAKSAKTREALGKAGVKQDALLKEQLPAWFGAVRALSNPAIAAYLQILLLTGARPGEVLALRWDDINLQWRGITIRDKVEGVRAIPLTPYVWQLIASLPRRSAYIFASNRTSDQAITEPNHAHSRACKVAGVEGLTLHGLRRSFKSLTEWLEIPAGVVAQIMGHKPSATAERHYTVRPLDLLRLHHEHIEAWVLDQARVEVDATAQTGKLRVVS